MADDLKTGAVSAGANQAAQTAASAAAKAKKQPAPAKPDKPDAAVTVTLSPASVTPIRVVNNQGLMGWIADSFVGKFITGAANVERKVIGKKAYDALANVFGLFKDAEAAKPAVDTARENGDTKAAAAAAKPLLAKAGVVTADLTDDQIVAAFDRIYTALKTSSETGDVTAFIAAKRELASELAKLEKRPVISDRVKSKVTDTITVSNSGTKKFIDKITARVEELHAQPATVEGQKELLSMMTQLADLAETDISIRSSAIALNIAPEVIASIDQNLIAVRQTAGSIDGVAAQYRADLNNGDIIAEPTSLDGRIARNIYYTIHNCMDEVIRWIVENRIAENTEDDRVAKNVGDRKLIEDTAEEKKAIAKIEERTRMLKNLEEALYMANLEARPDPAKLNKIKAEILYKLMTPEETQAS